MPLPDGADRSRYEEALAGEAIGGELALGPLAQRAAQPVADGHSEAQLGPFDKRFRHVPVEDLSKRPFGMAVADLW